MVRYCLDLHVGGPINDMEEASLSPAQQGNKVSVHYTGKLDDGTIFDSSQGSDPLEFTIGQGQMIPGFEQSVVGMELGESKTVRIPVDEAYGTHRPEGVMEVDRSEIAPEMQLEVGMRLQATNAAGRPVDMMVVALNDDKVTMDANHPLAGKDLTFDIQVVNIS